MFGHDRLDLSGVLGEVARNVHDDGSLRSGKSKGTYKIFELVFGTFNQIAVPGPAYFLKVWFSHLVILPGTRPSAFWGEDGAYLW